jgi:hypothetical protein
MDDHSCCLGNFLKLVRFTVVFCATKL